MHDPPARAICDTDLYSGKFYVELKRVLKPKNGVLYHYIGDPESKESGGLYKGIIQRLMKAGFKEVRTVPSAFGVVAVT